MSKQVAGGRDASGGHMVKVKGSWPNPYKALIIVVIIVLVFAWPGDIGNIRENLAAVLKLVIP